MSWTDTFLEVFLLKQYYFLYVCRVFGNLLVDIRNDQRNDRRKRKCFLILKHSSVAGQFSLLSNRTNSKLIHQCHIRVFWSVFRNKIMLFSPKRGFLNEFLKGTSFQLFSKESKNFCWFLKYSAKHFQIKKRTSFTILQNILISWDYISLK